MKLSVSNIIWKKGINEIENFIYCIKKNQINSIELALSCLYEEPVNINKVECETLNKIFEKHKVTISALHSLTFTRPDLELFKSQAKREELIEYIKKYIDLARIFSTKNIVFGSPKSRIKYNKTKKEGDEIFIESLSKIDSFLDDICLNIEPLPKSFCEYLNTISEALEVLKIGKFKNISIQIDLKSIIEEDDFKAENFIKNKNYFKHVQVSDRDFSPSSFDEIEIHNKMISILNQMEYDGFISLEAVIKEPQKEIEVSCYLKDFNKIYGEKI